MWNSKHPIAPGFDWRLKAALDRITPPPVMPRYAMAQHAFRPWRLAPIALAGAATVLLALTAVAATGSANPVVWSQRAASTIEAVGRAPETSPSPVPSPERSPNTTRRAPAAAPTHGSQSKASAKPTEHTEEPARPTPTLLPNPDDEHSGSSSPRPSPKPSPTPDDR
jgi:hypothetical protein